MRAIGASKDAIWFIGDLSDPWVAEIAGDFARAVFRRSHRRLARASESPDRQGKCSAVDRRAPQSLERSGCGTAPELAG